jgi:GNAT superfamily N-acetyltransferase
LLRRPRNDGTVNISMIEIIPYQTEHQPWFEKFNRDWIEKTFWMEPLDFAILQNPDEYILKPGGTIFMALYEKEMAGTAAMKFSSPGVFELVKMGVDEKFRGKKIGKALAETAIRWAVNLKSEKVILTSSTKLPTAIGMYRKLGFVEVLTDGLYARGDIKMELKLI